MFKRVAVLALSVGLVATIGTASASFAAQPFTEHTTGSTHDVAKKTPLGKDASRGKHDTAKTTKDKRGRVCRNALVKTLKHAGFRGEDLREAWAIAMRESGGRPKAVSSTHDYGLFQFNRATFATQSWWHSKRLLRAKYSAKLAHRYSRGGHTWYLWGLDGKGRAEPVLYRRAGWSTQQVRDWIVKPYRKWYAKYPC